MGFWGYSEKNFCPPGPCPQSVVCKIFGWLRGLYRPFRWTFEIFNLSEGRVQASQPGKTFGPNFVTDGFDTENRRIRAQIGVKVRLGHFLRKLLGHTCQRGFYIPVWRGLYDWKHTSRGVVKSVWMTWTGCWQHPPWKACTSLSDRMQSAGWICKFDNSVWTLTSTLIIFNSLIKFKIQCGWLHPP